VAGNSNESSGQRLVEILREVRSHLARPGTDFAWSSWADGADALAEIDELIAQVRSGNVLKRKLDLLFAPTASLQEISISNGWGDEFLGLARAYDDVVAVLNLPFR
jgi:hypothetical protein